MRDFFLRQKKTRMTPGAVLLFLTVLLYLYYLAYDLQHHHSSKWSTARRLMFWLLPLSVFVYLFWRRAAIYTAPTLSGILSVFSPLFSWTFLLPITVCLFLAYYTYRSTSAGGGGNGVNISLNVFSDPLLTKDGKLNLATPNRGFAMMNLLLILFGAGVVVFSLTILVTVLQFQRNQLGMTTYMLLYLPCLISDWLRWVFGEKESAEVLGDTTRSLASTTPKVVFVSAILLAASAFGFRRSLNTRRSWEQAVRDAKELTGAGGESEGGSPDRKALVKVTPEGKDVRLHDPVQFSLAALLLLQQQAAISVGKLNHIWALRFRLFVNTQQAYFYRGEVGSNATLYQRSRNVLSFGESDPSDGARRDITPVANFLEVRVCDRGMFVVSQFFAESNTSPVIAPLSFQSWHDVVVQHTGSKMDVAIDGKLVITQSTSTASAPSTPVLSPESAMFFLGQEAFNGALADVTIAFNDAYTSLNFDHDPLLNRQ